jgi:hypothetical protein
MFKGEWSVVWRCMAVLMVMAALGGGAFPAQVVHAATIVVDNNSGSCDGSCSDGDCSLCEAVASAVSGDTITFAEDYDIWLGNELSINKTLTVDAQGLQVTIHGKNYGTGLLYRVLTIGSSGNLTLRGLTLTDGYGYSGGAINNDGGTLVIEDCAIHGNEAQNIGGAIYNRGHLTLRNSTISGNVSANAGFSPLTTSGGAILQYASLTSATSATIEHSTIAGNTDLAADTPLAVIVMKGTLTLKNSIVADNGSGGTDNFGTNGGSIVSNGYNISNDWNGISTTTGDRTGDPLLGTLADNGGPTWTHALGAGSPALDAGLNGATLDQRGAARPYNGTVDMGAYEYRNPVQNCSLATGTETSVGNVTLNFSTLGTLTCVTVEEMGTDHPAATGPGAAGVALKTGNWWHISGDGSGFETSVTLPYSGADANTRVCRWPGGLGGNGWNCGPLDGTGTTFGAGVSVTRAGQMAFSDWAAGDYVGPTAVSAQGLTARGGAWMVAPTILVVGIWAFGWLAVTRRIEERRKISCARRHVGTLRNARRAVRRRGDGGTRSSV